MQYRRNIIIRAVMALASTLVASAQQNPSQLDQLARRLADLATRDAAVDEVVASSAAMTPVLLAWATKPPADVPATDLNIGLAEAFDRMATEAAIPFLIRVIAIKRFPFTFAPWIKGASSIKLEYPAAEALIRIGPTAGLAVIKAAQGPMTPVERLVAIFVVGQIDGVPAGPDFLLRARGDADTQRVWAQDGIERQNRKENGRKGDGK